MQRKAVTTRYITIFLVCFATLLLEISYTRIISYKLFYYYTYLVIGLALLGLGAGGVAVTISKRLRAAATESLLIWSSLAAAVGVAVGYSVVALAPFDSNVIWTYKLGDTTENIAWIVTICIALFVGFVPAGIVLSTLFGRYTENVGRLYFADLLGAGLACAVVISLLATIGPTRTIFLAGLLLALVALWLATPRHSRAAVLAGLIALVMLVGVISPGLAPTIRLDATKARQLEGKNIIESAWSPIFRVDVVPWTENVRALYHDGMIGSALYAWDGKTPSLAKYQFEKDIRALPFAVLGTPPDRELIIGAAGGHEVIASLHFGAQDVTAVELNPVTHSLVVERMADYVGHLAQDPRVDYINGDGRTYLARSDEKYDLIWYPAPDSYAATNAATAGAFVLSESYLYTSDAIRESLLHLTQDGIIAAQFGDLDFATLNRTARYIATAKHALKGIGVDDATDHMLVATSQSGLALSATAVSSTILVKRTPFTAAEVERFTTALVDVPLSTVQHAPGVPTPGSRISWGVGMREEGLQRFYARNKSNVAPITDDDPFFWHFSRFKDVVRDFAEPIDPGMREGILGERVLIMLLILAVLLGGIFLLLPFFVIRKTWKRFPFKGRSLLYFGAIGLGFFFFEVTMIQRLILFLGFPTYSLTVTLMSLLLFTGVGALLSSRLGERVQSFLPILLGAIAVLTLFYLVALPALTTSLLGLPFFARAAFAFAVLAPLGVCLGMFMPIGLTAIASVTDSPSEYVAWAWAVNGFASVVGSVLTTILAMEFGFRVVLLMALGLYVIAVVILRGLLAKSKEFVALEVV
ncbi:MAG: hypothetical protein EXQ69_09535 [Acidimicrobiia bacterium]|nr:hypothetical protein [Acidimicrobiia bacterium]